MITKIGKDLAMEVLSSLFLICFIAIWFGGSMLLLAKTDGWSELAEKYPCDSPYNGPKQGWQWVKINWAAYKGCLWLAFTVNGLYLEIGPSFLFSAFHPPLCIPWAAIKSVRECKYWWMRVIEIKFHQSDVKLMLRAKFLSDLKQFLGEKVKLANQDSPLIES